MLAKALCVLLLTIPFLPLLNAQYLLRGELPLLTAAPLFVRENSVTCPSGQTSCVNDGGGGRGCCSMGVSCAFSNGVPICVQPCLLDDITCTSDLSGFCCKPGNTCNYQSSACVPTGIGNSPPPTTSKSSPPPITSVSHISSTVVPPPTSPTSKPTTPSTSPIKGTSSNSTSQSSTTTSKSSTTTTTSAAITITSTATTKLTTTSATTGAQVQSVSGQDKLRLSLKVLLVNCGLAFLWG